MTSAREPATATPIDVAPSEAKKGAQGPRFGVEGPRFGAVYVGAPGMSE